MTRPRKKSRRKRDSNPGPSALEEDVLTTRPTRRWLDGGGGGGEGCFDDCFLVASLHSNKQSVSQGRIYFKKKKKKKKKSRRTTTLRQRSHIKLAIKSSHSTLGSGQPVLALTLYRQAG